MGVRTTGVGANAGTLTSPESGSVLFRQLRDSESDLRTLEIKLEQIRTEFRLGHDESASRGLLEVKNRLEGAVALASNPTKPNILLAEANSLHGSALRIQGKYKESNQALEHAVTLFQQISAPPSDGAGQFFADYGVALFLLGRKTEALSILEKAKQAGTTVPHVDEYIGLIQKEQGDLAAAAPFFAEAAKADPDNADVLISLAETLERLDRKTEAGKAYCDAGYVLASEGRYNEARTVFQSSLRCDAEDVNSLFAAGEIARWLGNFEEAVSYFEQVLNKRPSHALSWTGKSEALLGLKRYGAALAAARRALSIAPNDVGAVLAQSEALKRYKDAAKCIDRALASAPANERLLYRKGELLDRNGQLERMIPVLDHALEIAPVTPGLVAMKSWVLYRLERIDEAVSLLRRSIELNPDIAAFALEMAKHMLDHDQIDTAEQVIEIALKEKSTDAQSWLLLSRCLESKREWQRALDAVNESLELDGGNADALNRKGRLLKDLGRLDEAITVLNKAVELKPELDSAWFQLSEIFDEQEHYQQALHAIDQCLAIRKDMPLYVGTKGRLLFLLSLEQEAESELRRALALDPMIHFARRSLLDLLTRQSRFKDALPIAEEGAKLAPKDADFLVRNAECLQNLRRHKQALKLIGRALTLDPDSGRVLTLKADCLLSLDQAQAALPLFQKAVDLDPKLRWAWQSLGYVLRILGKADQALFVLNRAVEFHPNDVGVLSEKAWVLMELGQLQEAAKLLRKVSGLAPRSGYVHAQLGKALRRLGDWEGARQAFDQAVELDPNVLLTFAVRSEFLAEIGEFHEAAEAARRAIKLEPSNAWIYSLLGWALLNDRNSGAAEAKWAYEQAWRLDKSELSPLKGIGDALLLMGKKAEARKKFRKVLDLARSDQHLTSNSLLAWCDYCLGHYDDAIGLYVSSLSSGRADDWEEFDLALVLLCAGKYRLGVDTYLKRAKQVASMHRWKRRGLFHVAFFDLVDALRDPDVPNATSAAKEVSQSFRLLKKSLEQAGGAIDIALPPPKQALRTAKV